MIAIIHNSSDDVILIRYVLFNEALVPEPAPLPRVPLPQANPAAVLAAHDDLPVNTSRVIVVESDEEYKVYCKLTNNTHIAKQRERMQNI